MKKPTQKQVVVSGALVAALLLFIWWRKKNGGGTYSLAPNPMPMGFVPPAGNGGDSLPLTPIDYTYASNPSQFGPTNINVTVNESNPDWLATGYIPMFGFVGMAQGSTWQ